MAKLVKLRGLHFCDDCGQENQRIFEVESEVFGGRICFCYDCLRRLRETIDPFMVLVKTGENTK